MLEDYRNAQPIAYKIVMNSIKNNHIAHAYIIETNGYFKGFDFALSFAKSLLCDNFKNGQTNCQNCRICKSIDENNYPELKIINPDGYWIKKEQLLDLKNEFNKKTILGNKKIYIINKADRLNVNSANTILKFLEEPEEGIIAILITDSIYQLLNTIISRCQIISLNGQVLTDDNSTMSKIGYILTDNDVSHKEFITDEKNIEKLLVLLKFIDFYEKNNKKVLLYMNKYWFSYFNDKESISDALLIMTHFYKDVLNYLLNLKVEIFNEYMDEIKSIGLLNNVAKLVKKITIINDNRKYIENNANLNLLMDKIIIELEEGVR